MTHAFVNNGETQLLLIPSNELERQLLKKLMEDDSEIALVQENINLLGKSLSGSVIIRKRPKTTDAGSIKSTEFINQIEHENSLEKSKE